MEQDPSGSAAALAQNTNGTSPRTQNHLWMRPLTPRQGILLGKGTLPWDFITKCLHLRIMGGKKSRAAQNWPGQLVLSRGGKFRISPKGLDVPHAGMPAPTLQHRWKTSSVPGSALNHQQIWEQWPHPRVKRGRNATPCRELQNLARRGPNPAHGPAGNGPGSPVSCRKT